MDKEKFNRLYHYKDDNYRTCSNYGECYEKYGIYHCSRQNSNNDVVDRDGICLVWRE